MAGLQEHLHSLYASFGRQACCDLRKLGQTDYAVKLEALYGPYNACRLSNAQELAAKCYGLLQTQVEVILPVQSRFHEAATVQQADVLGAQF